MSSTQEDPIAAYGLTAVPADPSKPSPSSSEPPALLDVSHFAPPSSALADRIRLYAHDKLPTQTYNHSLRVYSYGRIIAESYFPQFGLTGGSKLDETWFITAMLHDIGTTPNHIHSTKLSYEFWAGLHTRDLLLNDQEGVVAPVEQMESIVEAIIRHQDVQEKGSISTLTRLIHLGTLMDNIGKGKEMVHEETIKALNVKYSRKQWSGCFRDTVELEKRLKPWAMVSRIEGFEDAIEENGKTIMKEWDA